MSHMKDKKTGRAGKAVIASMLGLILAGCAQVKNVPPGSSFTEVESQFGKPTLTCPLPSGGTRAIWSQQPYGHFAWATDISPEGDTGEMVQVLTDESFNRLQRGIWTAEDVRCAFGPPAIIDEVGLPAVRTKVWSYRYRQNGVWYSLMYIYFPLNADRVLKYNAGPDPMFEQDNPFPRL